MVWYTTSHGSIQQIQWGRTLNTWQITCQESDAKASVGVWYRWLADQFGIAIVFFAVSLSLSLSRNGTMSVSFELLTLTSPNPNPSSWRFSKGASMAFCPSQPSPTSLRFQSVLRSHRTSTAARTVCPTGLNLGLLPRYRHSFRNRSVFALAASHEKPSEIGVEKENKVVAEESQEAWRQTLASFKEQALKMQSVSQEAYKLYSKKAMVILKEISEQLKIQAEMTRHDLNMIAKEISEEGKDYLSTAAEQSPEPVKDIVETFAYSTDDVKEISEVRDFYLGIPYGILLSFGGFLSFMLTGRISAIRFGVILGGTLLALSIASLRSWKRGESFLLALNGQAAIASILFLREIRLLFGGPSVAGCFTALFSGAMVVFYIYRMRIDGLTNTSNSEHGTES